MGALELLGVGAGGEHQRAPYGVACDGAHRLSVPADTPSDKARRAAHRPQPPDDSATAGFLPILDTELGAPHGRGHSLRAPEDCTGTIWLRPLICTRPKGSSGQPPQAVPGGQAWTRDACEMQIPLWGGRDRAPLPPHLISAASTTLEMEANLPLSLQQSKHFSLWVNKSGTI